MEYVRDALGRQRVSERQACRVLGQPRSVQRRSRQVASDQPVLVRRMVALASEYGRYGYRRVTALLRAEGFRANHKRVERLWRLEGLKVPQKQPKRKRLWLNDGSCIRLRPTTALPRPAVLAALQQSYRRSAPIQSSMTAIRNLAGRDRCRWF